MEITDTARRVAAIYLKAQGVPPEAAGGETAGLPKSKPGRDLLKKQLDQLMSAFESGDAGAFDKGVEELARHKNMVR